MTNPDERPLIGSLRKHQTEALHRMQRDHRLVLADEMGLGKTLSVLALAATLRDSGALSGVGCRVLVLAPAPLLPQWKGEVEKWLPDFTVETTGHGRWKASGIKHRKDWDSRFPAGPDILIATYHLVAARQAEFLAYSPTLVVLDEASALKGGGKLHEAVLPITQKASRVVALTGTPVENNPMEAYRLLQAIHAPGLWPLSEYKDFLHWTDPYTIHGTNKQVPAIDTDFEDEYLPGIQAFANQYVLRRCVENTDVKLPVRVGEHHRYVPLGWAQEAAYKAAKWHDDPRSRTVAREQAGRFKDGESTLVDELMRELKEHPEKTIVYCETLKVLDLIEERMRRAGIGYVRLDGAVERQNRIDLVARFADDEGIQVLIGSKVLEYGLNLQFCRKLVSLDWSWNKARENQREFRIRRMGSPHENYQHLVLLPKTEQTEVRKTEILDRKATLIERFLGRP